MSKAVFIPQGKLCMMNIIDYEGGLDWLYKTLSCECVTFAHAYALDKADDMSNVDIVCDDEGLFKEGCQLNIIGSLIYGFRQHGQPLVGDCLLVNIDPETGETHGFDDYEIAKLLPEINALL